jgi:transposase
MVCVNCACVVCLLRVLRLTAAQQFAAPGHLASYSGLMPGLEQSGTKNRGKGITKEGRREFRWALAEAAWQDIRSNPRLRAEYDQLCQRKLSNQAGERVMRSSPHY